VATGSVSFLTRQYISIEPGSVADGVAVMETSAGGGIAGVRGPEKCLGLQRGCWTKPIQLGLLERRVDSGACYKYL